ncbi:hypothetical protein GUITHDRAFT_152797, partial [Guillardia theta CCMP2712]
MAGKKNSPAEWDVIELENFVRAPFRSGGTKVFDDEGNLQYLPGPQKIPMTRGRQEIYMHGKNIGNDGAKLVANELKKNTDCLSLWLHNNGIRKEGATELAKALQFNTTLTVLDLHENDIGNEGASSLGKYLKENTTLKKLNLSGNGIGPTLPRSLAKHPTLNCLCFEVVTPPSLVLHDPWTTSVSQLSIKKAKMKEMEFRWEPGSKYGITGVTHLQDPWQRTLAPTLFPGLTPIPKGLSGVSRDDPEFDPSWKYRSVDDL